MSLEGFERGKTTTKTVVKHAFPFFSVWMMRIPLLLLDHQFYRAMIRSINGFVDQNIFNARNERLGNQEVVDPPPHPALPGIGYVRPPGVLDAVGIEAAIRVDESVIQKALHPLAFFRQEAGGFLIGLGISEVDRHVSRIEVAGDNDTPTVGVNAVADRKQMSVKIELIVQALFAALAVRKVDIK